LETRRFNPLEDIASSSTPPASWYTDSRFLAYEKEMIFMRNWIYAGRKALLRENNSFITGEFLGEPYIITRDSKGHLAAFYNVCRHHACTLKEKMEGKCDEIVCPYHGWTYTLDGKIKKGN
jgi:choline monooxygenase